MKTATAAQSVNEPGAVIPVRIYLGADGIYVDPPQITLPWNYVGTVRWTLDSEGLSFDDPGIWFPVVSPFQPHRVSATVCEMQVDNDAALFTGPYKYDIKLTEGHHEIVIDPTVENDPPPPHGHPPVKPRRQTRAAGAGKA